MRIISKFHDYYDCIQSLGIDKTIIYERKTEEIETVLPKNVVDILKDISRIYINGIRIINSEYLPTIANPFFVIIVDKCYFGVEYNSIFFYDEKSFNNYLSIKKLSIESFHKPLFLSIDIDIKWSIDHKCPIFIYDSDKQKKNRPVHYLEFEKKRYNKKYDIIKNPFLKEYQFYKIMEPFVIYQKINQFISGILANPEKEPWPISDKLKAESHGFDKWSFRKKPKDKK